MFVGLSEEAKVCGCVEEREVGREATVKLSSPLKTQLSGPCIL